MTIGMEDKILIIDDNQAQLELLRTFAGELGFSVEGAVDGEGALRALTREQYQLVLLDLNLPGISGLEVLSRIRAQGHTVPVIIVTSSTGEEDLERGFAAGANEFLRKPVGRVELKACINAVLRRAKMSSELAVPQVVRAGELEIDLARRTVSLGAKEVELTKREFDILAYLAQNPGKAISRSEINAAVFGYDVSGYEDTISVHINHIRAKLESDLAAPQYIRTVRGVGYAFCELSEK